MPDEKYIGSDYLENNPTWHVEDSAWKAQKIAEMMRRNDLAPGTVCEVGSGAGEVLRRLQDHLPDGVRLDGWEIAPDAHAMCAERANERLDFHLGDFLESDQRCDLLLLIDLIEHLENHMQFLRDIHDRADRFIMHIPLDLSVRNVIRAGELENGWETWGHIHQFTAGLALKTLDEAGYEVIDQFYTSKRFDNPPASVRVRLIQPWKKLLYRIAPDFAVRLMGGFSLMVLAQ